ncbi:MAG: hypothetical protein N2691_01910 [Patescibacteria group bacterium]|nr:hypothetical protein [Patescibacteria group bacterium]
MNNKQMPEDGRIADIRYDPAGSDYRGETMHDSTNRPRQGSSHAAKLASLSIVFSLMVVIGSAALVVNNRANTTATRASSENLGGPASISEADKSLTSQVTDFPVKYRSRVIPPNLVDEANLKYVSVPEKSRREYIINRIVLYYIYDDVLTTNNVQFQGAPQPLTFEGIESALPGMSAIMQSEYPQPELFVQEYLSRFEFE